MFWGLSTSAARLATEKQTLPLPASALRGERQGGRMIENPTDILAHHADREASDSFTAWRKKIRKPLTERAALMIAKTLADINAAGGDATEALDMAQEHGWQTIKSDWYWRQKDGNRNRQAGSFRADAADREIAFAARAHRTPSEDCF